MKRHDKKHKCMGTIGGAWRDRDANVVRLHFGMERPNFAVERPNFAVTHAPPK